MWNWHDLRSSCACVLSHVSVGGGQDVKIISRNYDSRSSLVRDDESNRIQQKLREFESSQEIIRQSCKNYQFGNTEAVCFPGSSRYCCRPSLLKLPNFLVACPSQYLEAIDQNSWRGTHWETGQNKGGCCQWPRHVCRESVSGRFVAALNSSADWWGSEGAGFVNKWQTSESILNFVALFPFSLDWPCKERHISIIYDTGPAKPHSAFFKCWFWISCRCHEMRWKYFCLYSLVLNNWW